MLINPYQKEWTKEEIEFLKLNHKTMSIKEMSNNLVDRTPSSVQNKCNKMGFKKESKYNYNHDFFEKINSEEKAYWFGFICADGYISHSEMNAELGIELAIRDIEHLKKFNKSLNGNIDISTRKRNSITNKEIETCCIRIYSKKMVNDLINLGITNDKTYNLSFPQIESKYYIPFIRGFFDGDGALYIDKGKLAIHNNITSASLVMLEKIREIMYLEYGITSYISKDSWKELTTVQIYQLNFKGLTNGYNFANLLYSDANIYLNRKYNLFKEKTIELDIENRINKKGRTNNRYACLSNQ